MRPRKNPDIETLSLFVVLGLLTALFVLGVRWALFVPSVEMAPRIQEHQAVKAP